MTLRRKNKVKNPLEEYTSFVKRRRYNPPYIGKHYNKYRILIIGQNRLGDKNHLGEELRYHNHSGFNKEYLKKYYASIEKKNDFSSNVLKKPLEIISEILNIDSKEAIEYVAFTNVIKTPTPEGTPEPELGGLYRAEAKYRNKILVEYELSLLNPKIVMIIGQFSANMLFESINEIKENKKLNYLLYYKKTPLIVFYHVSRGWWTRKVNRITKKKKYLKRLITCKA